MSNERDELAAIKERVTMLELVPSQDAEFLLSELEKAKRGAKTLGEIIEKQCRDVLEVTGLHHLINEDGDGHWDVVWMRLFEMRDELASLKESTISRERHRGDSWRDRAQDLQLRLDATEPRRVSTVEEMDALPVGSVVLDREGMALQKTQFDLSGTGWNASNGTRDIHREELERDCFPATVLHIPEAG